MPFGVKNGPRNYQKAVTKPFCEYIDVFMKIFLDDFCRNPSFGLATKAKGIARVWAKRKPMSKPRGSPRVKSRGSPRVKAKGSPGVTSHTPGSARKC